LLKLKADEVLAKDRLLSLATTLKAHGQHLTLYSGYTLEELLSLTDPAVSQILDLADMLIDGPFVKELSCDAGEWRGSTNQRIIHLPLPTAPETRYPLIEEVIL
jgi:anaerobic ribonucleoside-triphosphate reductase activating protein